MFTNRHFWKLQASLLVFSVTSVIAKFASSAPFPSLRFVGLYTVQLSLFLGYAVVWQRLLKHLDLSLVYSSKGLTLLWSLLWAVTVFGEAVTVQNILGCAVVLAGIILIGTE
jgi:drug/metabolite transporter (DMT)-like permease